MLQNENKYLSEVVIVKEDTLERDYTTITLVYCEKSMTGAENVLEKESEYRVIDTEQCMEIVEYAKSEVAGVEDVNLNEIQGIKGKRKIKKIQKEWSKIEAFVS